MSDKLRYASVALVGLAVILSVVSLATPWYSVKGSGTVLGVSCDVNDKLYWKVRPDLVPYWRSLDYLRRIAAHWN